MVILVAIFFGTEGRGTPLNNAADTLYQYCSQLGCADEHGSGGLACQTELSLNGEPP